MLDVVLEVGGNTLQPADRDRRLLDAATAAGGLARAVTGAAEDSRKHVGLPVDHIGVAIAPFRDQPDVFRNGRVRGTGPLAIDNLVKVIGSRNIGGFHPTFLPQRFTPPMRPLFARERSSRRSCYQA